MQTEQHEDNGRGRRDNPIRWLGRLVKENGLNAIAPVVPLYAGAVALGGALGAAALSHEAGQSPMPGLIVAAALVAGEIALIGYCMRDRGPRPDAPDTEAGGNSLQHQPAGPQAIE